MKRKLFTKSAFFSPRALLAVFLCAATACFILFPIRSGLAFLHPQRRSNPAAAGLTFEERVSYQRAIEDVYWRHRIWPKENSNPKPPLDAVMSQAQLEKKVADYLRKSQALEDYWQRPITAEQLQAEMDRMARHTRQPEVLQELFDALGNDPFVIAECLARPALAQRLVTNWYAHDQRIHGELKQRAEAELQTHPAVEQMKQLSGKYSEIELAKRDAATAKNNRGAEHSLKLNPPEWDKTLQNLATAFGVRRQVAAFKSAAMSAHSKSASNYHETLPIGKLSSLQEDETRYYAIAILNKTSDRTKLATISWLKEPMQSWLTREQNQSSTATAAPSGNYTLPAILRGGCIDDTWTATAAPPEARADHTAVWTGSEMIIWGGGNSNLGVLNTGGRYNPGIDTWTTTSITNAPAARENHTAVWTGTQMIVWGGIDQNFNELNTGGRYNPDTDSWTATTTSNAPDGRNAHTALWSGSEMIVWGGWDGGTFFNTGGRYNPNTDSWTATSITNAPEGRTAHTAVWTDGGEMIVWGGNGEFNILNTGGRYNPNTDSWTATSTTNAPDPRSSHTAVSAGTAMIVWGGLDEFGDALNTGGRYNPSTNTWTATSTTNAPDARELHTAVWTGTVMIVWGGSDGFGGTFNTGGRYNPSTDSWTATSTTNAPDPRQFHTAVWTGSEMIVWGGVVDFFTNFDVGGRYNPSSDSWTNVGTIPSPRISHTAVWTGGEMIIWGGDQQEFVLPLNTGARYEPATDNWTVTSTTNAPDARDSHTAVWTGSEMIIWGGNAGFGGVNTGGRYNPGADSWTATSTVNAAEDRSSHTAVWTGNEMIVWGGLGIVPFSPYLNTGGKYNPGTNTWTATSTSNAPTGRYLHTAIWSGSDMIVWGGTDDNITFDTGGRYSPTTNSWTATSTTNAPSARELHTAVWTGSEMTVWGGFDGTDDVNTGGRYTPTTNTWAATSTTNAPDGRDHYTAVWTGTEMIVWGGFSLNLGADVNTGGRYNPGTDSWMASSITDAPESRDSHTAIWTDNEMIVWGGQNDFSNFLDTGGRYCAQGGPPPTPTPTPTVTPTPSSTPTPTATPRVTPRPRPTPHPRPTPR